MSDNFISNFSLRFRNAKKVINQIKAGEWVPVIDEKSNIYYAAHTDGHMLWLANGAYFCDLRHPDSLVDLKAFGLIFRHWVWWAAARNLKAEAEKKILVKYKTPHL